MRIDEIIAERKPTFSIEFFPPKTPEATEELFATAKELRALEPDFVSVTYGAGGSTRDGTVEITAALKDEIGFETMAHLSCVGETTEGLATTLDRIEAAGIENVFALRGDPPRGQADFVQPEGGLGSAAELAAFVSAGWDFGIGGTCFPEVHPEAPDLEADLRYLKTKVDAGAGFLITQLFFDNQVYFDFVRAARRAGDRGADPGGRDPGHQLRPDEADLRPLRRDDPACPRSGLRGRRGRAGARVRAGDRLRGAAVRGAADRRRAGIHFYALNRAPATRAVLGALKASRPWERVRGDAAEMERAD